MHKSLMIPEGLTLLNVGNTHIQIAEADGVKSIPTGDADPEMVIKTEKKIAAASVVPQWSDVLRKKGAFLVDPEHCGGMDLSRIDSSTVGADRLANAVAAMEYGNLPVIVIDFGTAITFEVVDAKRRFAGGAIMPGRALLRKALNAGTAQLPLIACGESCIPEIGRNTREAILLGVDRGVIGSVKCVLESILNTIEDCKPAIIGTGGDFGFFKGYVDNMIDGGWDFTLRGILRAWEFNGDI